MDQSESQGEIKMKTESQESQGELSELSNADLEEVCGGYGLIYDGDLVDVDVNISLI